MSFFFFKQKTAYEIRKGDWSSDVCSSDLCARKKICAPRATAKVADVRWSSIREPTSPFQGRNGVRFRKHACTSCTLCAAVIFSTLDSTKKSRFYESLTRKIFLRETDATNFFMLVCGSSP